MLRASRFRPPMPPVEEPLVVGTDERSLPGAVLVEVGLWVSRSRVWKPNARAVALPTAAASSRIAFILGSGENGWSLRIPIPAASPPELGVQEIDRFAGDHLCDFGVKVEVVGVDGVERVTQHADELHRRRVPGLSQRVDLQPSLHDFAGTSGRPSTSNPRRINQFDELGDRPTK